MRGDKYGLAIYSLQLVAACMNPEDELYLVRGNRVTKIERSQNHLKSIERLSRTGTDSYNLLWTMVEEIQFKPNEKKEIIILGDGIWSNSVYNVKYRKDLKDNSPEKFQAFKSVWDKFYMEHKPGIYAISFQNPGYQSEYHLPTLYDYLLRDYPLANYEDIVITDYKKGKERLEETIARILDVAIVKDFKISGGKSISFSFKVPVKSVVVLYQPAGSGTQDKNSVKEVKHKSSHRLSGYDITNRSTPDKQNVFYGHISHITPKNGKSFQANSPFEVTFSNDISSGEVAILPMPDINVGLALGNTMHSIDEKNNVIRICRDQEKLDITALITAGTGETLPISQLADCSVSYVSNYGKGKLSPRNGKYQVAIPFDRDTTIINIHLSCQGLMDVSSLNYTIIREDCITPSKDVIKDMGEKAFDPPIPFSALTSNNSQSCIHFFPYEIINGDSIQVKTSGYKLKLEGIPYGYYAEIKESPDKESWQVCLRVRGACECFVRSGAIEIVAYMESKQERIESQKHTLILQIQQDKNWLERCFKALLYGLLTFLFLIYFFLLYKKPRFKGGSYVQTKRVNQIYEEEHSVPYGPIKKLPTNFISRYLIPVLPERNDVNILAFEAMDNKNIVLIKASCLNKDKMRKDGQHLEYYIDIEEGHPSKGEKVMDGYIITVTEGDNVDYYKITIP